MHVRSAHPQQQTLNMHILKSHHELSVCKDRQQRKSYQVQVAIDEWDSNVVPCLLIQAQVTQLLLHSIQEFAPEGLLHTVP